MSKTNCPTPREAIVQAIAGHIDGWKSATFGWQDDPDPAVAERNKQAAIEAHAAECLRRVRAALEGGEEPKPAAWLDSFGEPHRRREDAWDGEEGSAEPRPLYASPIAADTLRDAERAPVGGSDGT